MGRLHPLSLQPIIYLMGSDVSPQAIERAAQAAQRADQEVPTLLLLDDVFKTLGNPDVSLPVVESKVVDELLESMTRHVDGVVYATYRPTQNPDHQSLRLETRIGSNVSQATLEQP